MRTWTGLVTVLTMAALGFCCPTQVSAQTKAKAQVAQEAPISISAGELKGRFSKETKRMREKLAKRVEEFNASLPDKDADQGAEDVRGWLKLKVDLEDASRKAAWAEHESVVVPTLEKPGPAAQEAFRKVLAEEEKARAEEQERIKREIAKAEELRLKAEENQIEAAKAAAQAEQAAAMRQQAEALERQARALEWQAYEQRRMRKMMEP